MFSNPLDDSRASSTELLAGIDPIALGQAGLQALALAGTAILARYADSGDPVGGITELRTVLPRQQWSILMRALGAFADPHDWPPDADRRRAEAATVMCLHARATLTRPSRTTSRRVVV
jgi:hypothetical protein